MGTVVHLVEDVDGAENVVGPEADHKQEEDKEGLLGTSLVPVGVGKVWPRPWNSEEPRCYFYIAEQQHGENEPEEDHH